MNDLIRKGNREAKLIVIDPSLEAVVNRVCATLNQDLRPYYALRTFVDCQCKTGGRLMFVKAKAEDVNSTRLLGLLE